MTNFSDSALPSTQSQSLPPQSQSLPPQSQSLPPQSLPPFQSLTANWQSTLPEPSSQSLSPNSAPFSSAPPLPSKEKRIQPRHKIFLVTNSINNQEPTRMRGATGFLPSIKYGDKSAKVIGEQPTFEETKGASKREISTVGTNSKVEASGRRETIGVFLDEAKGSGLGDSEENIFPFSPTTSAPPLPSKENRMQVPFSFTIFQVSIPLFFISSAPRKVNKLAPLSIQSEGIQTKSKSFFQVLISPRRKEKSKKKEKGKEK